MIDIHELRIGNLVYAYPFRIIKVSEITNLKSVLNEGDESEEPFADEELDGIPITQEILEKCGFEKTGNDWKLKNTDNSRDNTNYIEQDENKFTYVVADFGWDGGYDVEVKYVHQIQNLYFFLTGTELEINITE